MKRFPPNGYHTCNSCSNFCPAEYNDECKETTCTCKNSHVIGHEELSHKTVAWIFNCASALDCPHYQKTDEDYTKKCRKGWERIHLGDNSLSILHELAGMEDEEFYQTKEGQRYLENRGFYQIHSTSFRNLKKKVKHRTVTEKKPYILIKDKKGNIIERYDPDFFKVEVQNASK